MPKLHGIRDSSIISFHFAFALSIARMISNPQMRVEFHFIGLNPIIFLYFPKITKRIIPSKIIYRSSLFIYFFFHFFLSKVFFLEEQILKATQNNSLFMHSSILSFLFPSQFIIFTLPHT